MTKSFVLVVALVALASSPSLSQEVVLSTGRANYDLGLTRTSVSNLEGISYGVGYERYSKNKNWFLSDEFGLATDDVYDYKVAYWSSKYGKKYNDWTFYGTIDVTSIFINGANDGTTIDAGLGVGYDFSEHFALRFDVGYPITYLDGGSEIFGKQFGVHSKMVVQVKYKLVDLFGKKDRTKNEKADGQNQSRQFNNFSRK